MVEKRIVAVAGKFDPILEGHVEHILKASELGDYLYIITHSDETVARYSDKGFCATPLWVREALLEGLVLHYHIQGCVISAFRDNDGTVTETLKYLRPDIFAKGGDRTPDNMPQKELIVCHQLGIQIVYGIGRLLSSSSKIMARILND